LARIGPSRGAGNLPAAQTKLEVSAWPCRKRPFRVLSGIVSSCDASGPFAARGLRL